MNALKSVARTQRVKVDPRTERVTVKSKLFITRNIGIKMKRKEF